MIARLICLVVVLNAAGLRAQQADIGQPPGRLVDVGGRKLHLHCMGTGAPTVILEAGASAFAIDWSLVQPDVARTNRVCSYDRAGAGWSDSRPDVETPARIVADLHALLQKSGETPPFVMVGASWGGAYVRLYQMDYPADVGALVLVDPTSEDGLFTMYQQKGVTIASLTAEQLRSTLPPSGSIPIPKRPVQTGAPFDRLPADLYQLRLKFDQRLIDAIPPQVPIDIIAEFSEGQRAALARLAASRASGSPAGDRPLVVLTRDGGNMPAHAALAKMSTNSRHTMVPGSVHEIHLSVASSVVQAVQDVVAATRPGGRLAPQ
jgi:pimeloyl-ACP methyl ester carboxylesterase